MYTFYPHGMTNMVTSTADFFMHIYVHNMIEKITALITQRITSSSLFLTMHQSPPKVRICQW
jgi:hypothetical protein